MTTGEARTVWLLDVDGVLNVTRPGWGAAPHHATVYSRTTDLRWPFRWSPRLLTRIHRLRDTGLVELVWCTTWCCDADALERLWRFPPLRRAFDTLPDGHLERMALKLDAAQRVIDDGNRLIWTDDEVPDAGPVRDRLVAAGSLLISPSPRRGLQPADMDAIEAYAEAWAG
jgi:hypothetical protein